MALGQECGRLGVWYVRSVVGWECGRLGVRKIGSAVEGVEKGL